MNWEFLSPYKALTFSTSRTRNNYYVFISDIKKNLLMQCSAGRAGYNARQRFSVASAKRMYMLAIDFVIRYKKKYKHNKLVIQPMNMTYPIISPIIKRLQESNVSLLWVNERFRLHWKGCGTRLKKPRRI